MCQVCDVMCDICLFMEVLKSHSEGSLTKKWALHCEKDGKANTLFAVIFGVAHRVKSSNKDKKQAATRHSAPCGKLKCQMRKNLCIAYTQVSTHAHFFLSLSLFSFFSSMKVFQAEDTSPERSRAPWHDDG